MTGLKIFLKIAIIIFLIEGLIMYGFTFFPNISRFLETSIDSFLLVIFSGPLIYYFVIKPYTRHLLLAKQEAEESRLEADAANKAKTQFLANVSHELRTPLNAIIGFTETIQLGLIKDQNKINEYINDIHNSGENLLALVSDLLDTAKIDLNKVHINKEYCNLKNDIIKPTIKMLSDRANKKGIKIKTKLKCKHDNLKVDKDKFKQVITNILTNAIKFTKQGTILVEDNCDDEGFYVLVTDTGSGLTDIECAQVFDAFFRSNKHVKEAIEGTGIGLTICKHIVEAHGGHISVKSKINKGTTFTIHIPFHNNT